MFLLSLVSIILSFAACGGEKSKEKFTKTYFEYFDTVTTVVGYFDSEEEFLKVADLVLERLEEYHKLYDIYHSYEGITNLCDVNKLYDGVHKALTVDRKIIDLLLFAKEMHSLTLGETNVAMGALLSLWHDKRKEAEKNPENASLPDEEALVRAAFNSDIREVKIDEKNSTVYLQNPDMKLDVGAVAKGYATEMIAKELEALGVSGVSLNVGGNIRIIGPKPSDEPWVVGVTNPDIASPEPYAEYVELSGGAFVTSGSYQRFYKVGDKDYHHIIDKDTYYPSEYFTSVSVLAADSGMADALSTALFSMSYEDGVALVESLSGIEAVWITKSRDKLYSSGFSAFISSD